MKQKVTVNGKTYEVEFGNLMTSPIEVTVNGKIYLVAIESEGIIAPFTPTPTPPPTTLPTSITPAPSSAKAAKPAAAPAMTSSTNEVRAPMPGTILDVAVKAGDQVTVGHLLCNLEAMKMKNAIRSPREGKILSVEVSDGQKVAYGDLLVRFE